VTLTLSLSLLRCACKARVDSFALAAIFAAGEKARMRGGAGADQLIRWL
jgi:hypothetical protein